MNSVETIRRTGRGRRRPLPIPVGQLMVRNFESTDPRASLVVAAAQMRAARTGALVVLDGLNLIGILTERDIVRSVADGRVPALTHVSEYMSQSPLTVRTDLDVAQAAALMRQHGVRHLPVVDQRDQVVGVLSARTLLAIHRWPPVFEFAEPW